jgi:hypothetical protein
MVVTSVAAPGREKLADSDPQAQQGRPVERIEELLPIPPRHHEPGTLEDVEVVGHRRCGDAEVRRQSPGRLLTVAQEADYLPPRGVSEGFEGQIAPDPCRHP